ncbi:MAG TPA: TolC family protein [Candidatus Eisenbacteria bacterium]|nr:TolC family protein [Candidatus Eisenbacteria bacterium]
MARAWLWGLGLVFAVDAHAEILTASKAVQLALKNNSQVIGAEAGVLDARAGLYGAYSGILPNLSASISRSGRLTKDAVGNSAIGGIAFPPQTTFRDESYSTQPVVSGRWNILSLSNLSDFSSARSGLRAAKQSQQATRNDVALAARRQFYEVVRAVRLAQVSSGAVRLSRDDERRVRALFEVGSVSRSELYRAQVRTSQSQLDSVLSWHQVTVQRIALARLLGIRESAMGEVDTLLTATPIEVDEPALIAEAAKNRPDLQAADNELISAKASVNSARFLRLPYITLGGQVALQSSSTSTFDQPAQDSLGAEIPGSSLTSNTRLETDRSYGGQVALNWDFFDGLATDARIAANRARQMRAQENRDALYRNLESEVHQAVMTYREALEGDRLARRTLESATENLKLIQEKYNVGSSTILDLIDAQVQLQRAQSDVVSALAAIRVAEAQLNRVRGRAE